MTPAPYVPATYSEAAKVARTVTLDEFAAILAADDNPYVYPAPRTRRVIAMNARLEGTTFEHNSNRSYVSYDRCTFNTGYLTYGGALVGGQRDRAIFNFTTAGTVTVARPVTA